MLWVVEEGDDDHEQRRHINTAARFRDILPFIVSRTLSDQESPDF